MGKRNTELDVLVTVKDYGELGYFNGSHTKASKRLFSLYPEFSIAYGGKVSVLLMHWLVQGICYLPMI